MRSLSQQLARASLLAALLSASGWIQAQENHVVSTFDDDTSVSPWSRWWGNTPWYGEWDPAVDADGNANSGSMKNTFDWAPGVGDQAMVWRTLSGQAWSSSVMINGLDYTNLSFDIRWDPSSGKTTAGDYGRFTCGIELGTAWDTHQTLWATNNFPVTDGWVRIEGPIDPATAKIDQIVGVWFRSEWQPGAITEPQYFWIDNIVFHANTNKVIAPPTLSQPTPVGPKGLQIIASAPGDYPRQNIMTETANSGANYSWVGYGSQPVTYSLTVADFPGANYSGFQAHMFLVPNGGNDTSIDWNAADIVFVQLANDTNGNGTLRFMYKTNEPGGNSMIWNDDPTATNSSGGLIPVGTLATLTNSSPLGEWSVTFLNDTNVTMKAPDGSTTNFVMPPDSVAYFSGPVTAYFGNQPNGASKTGQSTTFSRIQITGLANPIDDTFPGPNLNQDPDYPTWVVSAPDPNGLVVITAEDRYWLSWTLPDAGFSLQSSPNLHPDSWVDPGLTNTVVLGKQKAVRVPTTALPSTQAGYFRMIKSGE